MQSVSLEIIRRYTPTKDALSQITLLYRQKTLTILKIIDIPRLGIFFINDIAISIIDYSEITGSTKGTIKYKLEILALIKWSLPTISTTMGFYTK